MKRTPNVIVIEDNDDDYEALTFAFEQDGAAGLDIERCTTAQEAENSLVRLRNRTDIAREDRVLIILDLRLPGLSGFELLKTMRQDPHLRRIPVIVLSSSSNQSDVIESYVTGANAYIRKPRNFDGYLKMVASFRMFWTGCAELPVLG
ncbi:response regulator [Sagittula stellata]|uniref:CheY-like receiver protein n=1 Tax=Sagittula stellata (strain ATCC 700073 / DSM 11524 / E-37) TaxID=388399 RepID=A3K0U3_SAGS3|nr:response regulator [Sagittula stellata]EBA09408.1 CheY-like receiver protein [Sagittula stellata E-37]